ncbi:hypothetical protein RN001_014007 [Aquatica leii]|uniref:Uncharacterized protein n=1 Tax=Aquatica leii TaxID=1421715 RepID=A0AAN7P0V3_9COLE|nr:hypothetical protein RN001_014007 [Aquatica leii]
MSFATNILLIFVIGHCGGALELRSGAYEDLIIGISDAVPIAECQTILANLEATLTSASQYLFSVLDGRAFLQSATVVLPASWPNSCAPKPVMAGSGDFQDVTILPKDMRGKIWTQQSTGCGQSGDQIYFGYEGLLHKDETLARLFVKNFAMYRFGVFEEEGYENDPIYPTCYYDDENKRNRVTGCSDLPIKDNGICSNGHDKIYNKSQIVDEKARSSILFAAEVPSVSMFCDEGTHDQYAPTKHNLICNRRSTFDIISNHADFSSNTISSNHHTNEITNTTPRFFYKKQNITRYILVIENTKDMQVRESWSYLRHAIKKWSLFDLPKNTEIGVILAQDNGATKILDIISLQNSNSWDVLPNIPFSSGDSGQPACLHCALKDAMTMLADQSKYRSAARNVIVLIAPGMNINTQLENLIKEAKKSKIRIVTINYPEVIRSQPLDYLATQTDGVAFTVVEQKYNVDTSMLSTYFELTNVLYSIIQRFYSGNPSDLPMEIHRRKLIDDGRTSVTGSFVLDDNMGEPARFMLYVHNVEQPLIRGLSLVSPGHQEYSRLTETMVIAKIISLAVNISEPGTWTYTIDRYTGNPQPYYVQVMATPRSRIAPVVHARFWIHANKPGGPLILLTEVKQGNWPVLGAKVEASFTRSEVNGSVAYTDRVELLDTGSGDPDITKGDGIYSRYFSAAAGGPGTYTFEVTVTDNGNTAYSWQGSFKTSEDKPCCGSIVPTSSVQPLSPFQRVLPRVTIQISSEDMVKGSQVAVGKIGDLKVQIKAEDMKALLTWTSPDMGGTRAARYQIKYATTYTDIVDNYEVLAKTWEHNAPHVLPAGSETTFTLDMTKDRNLLDKPLYFAVRAFPQVYSDALASPISNWVRVLVPSPPPPPTVIPTFIPSDQTPWPNQINSVGIDPVAPGLSRNGNFGIEVILPIVIGVVILAIILSLYCYFCVIKRRSRNNNKKPIKHSNGLQTDKLSSAVTIVPSSPLHSSQNSQGYINHSDLPDHHTVGVPINSYTYEDEPKKRYSLVHQQEQQLIEELKQQQFQNQQRELNTPNNTYAGLSVISSNSLQRGGHTLSPYNSWSASQLLHEHERRHSPLENMIPEDQLLAQHQSELDHMSLNGQNVDHISMNGHQIANQIPDHYTQTHAPPVPPLPIYNSNGYPINYNIYGVHQPQQMVATQQNHPIYQSMQRNEPLGPYNTSLQGSLNSVNSGEKKRRNVTMV